MPITTDPVRQIIDDFAKLINEKKILTPSREKSVINFRNEQAQNKKRSIFLVPLGLLRYRKENGRIASSVLGYERTMGALDPSDPDAQRRIAEFLRQKDPEKSKDLKRLLQADGQKEPGIITCDGFLINGNRRLMVLRQLHSEHTSGDIFSQMKVVILPAKGDEGGPPTLKEIEQIENRYQLQRDGKAEYYGFDAALSIQHKIDHGFTLEEQLRDDPQFRNMPSSEFTKEVTKRRKELLQPLKCVDRYLHSIGRPGEYQCVSKGVGDREGRWQAFTDYSLVYDKLCDTKKREAMGIDEAEVGIFEQGAFKIIRLRDIPNAGKLHMIMRHLPKYWKAGKEEMQALNSKVKDKLPRRECIDGDGNALSTNDVESKWQNKNRQQVSFRLAKARQLCDQVVEQETPLNLLGAALKKLQHPDMDITSIKASEQTKALKVVNDIGKQVKTIKSELYSRIKGSGTSRSKPKS